ncbi:hypothetical protein PIB30_098137 [Stylosanthes scabra]|uniref:Uncharacterized protein n=1 Tax=Stylosanthes scabra TaxID=79078 RepID=A0ABU6QVW6_9FABA|nr:hypothetical protein [Stylosanthes scabra]
MAELALHCCKPAQQAHVTPTEKETQCRAQSGKKCPDPAQICYTLPDLLLYRITDRRNPSRSGASSTFPTIHLLELFVLFADVGESGSFDVGVDTQSSGGVGRNIKRLMINLNIPHDSSIEGSNPGVDVTSEGILEEEIESHERSIAGDPMTHPYRVNPTQSDDEDVEVQDDVLPEDEEAVDDEDIHEVVLDALQENHPFKYA